MNLSPLLTAKEFAKVLRLKEKSGWQTILSWSRAGKLKGVAVRVGDAWRFPEDKVQKFIDRGGMLR